MEQSDSQPPGVSPARGLRGAWRSLVSGLGGGAAADVQSAPHTVDDVGAGDQRRPFAELSPEEQAERRREAARKAAATRARNRARQATQAKAQAQAAAAAQQVPAAEEHAVAETAPTEQSTAAEEAPSVEHAAPADEAASVEVESSLAPEPDVVVEHVQSAEPEPGPEPEVEPVAATDVEAEREVEAVEQASEVEPSLETEIEVDPEAETELTEPEVVTDSETDAGAEDGTEADAQHEPTAHAEPALETEPSLEPEPTTVDHADDAHDVLLEPEDTTTDVDEEPVEVVGVQSAVDDAPAAATAADAPASADGPAVVLRLEGVSRRFGATLAVDDVTLEVRAGECHGIVGPNGAGKSTTVSLAGGLMRPSSGSVQIGGTDVRVRGVQSQLGVVPDRMRLFDRLTGRQLLVHAALLRRVRRKDAITRAATLLERFDLTPDADRLVSDYSIGMQQLVGIAAALIHAPRVVVLDEPFESIDPVATDTILAILGDLRRRGGAVVLTSHDMALVERACDHVVVLQDGVVRASGPIDEVRDGLTLEDRFTRLVGASPHQELPWLSPSLD